MRYARLSTEIVRAVLVLAAVASAADITGKWTGQSEQGPEFTFNFKADGGTLTGSMLSREGKDLPINDGKIDGNALSFSVNSECQGNPIKLVMKGSVSADAIQLRIDTDDGAWGTDVTLKRSAK